MAILSVNTIFVLQLLLIVLVVIAKTGYVNNDETQDDNEEEQQQGKSFFGTKDIPCQFGFCSAKSRKYLLYDVNRGEGFNLRRDVYVRIGPIIKALNQKKNDSEWILVLPPWGQLSHWTRDSNFFGWKTFFNLDEIQKYIPAIEFEDYLDEYGLDNPIDIFYQLEHFPLDSHPSKTRWSENVQVCDTPVKWKRDSTTGLYTGRFWRQKLFAKNAFCLALKGQSSDIVNFLLDLSPESVLLDSTEVILWDVYGGKEWWSARLSLQFAPTLIEVAVKWMESKYPTFQYSDLKTTNYLAVHLRRGDFVLYKKEPTLIDVAKQIVKVLSNHDMSQVFIATDGTEEDVNAITKYITATRTAPEPVTFTRFDCKDESNRRLSDGECAIVDQIISSWAKYFIGSAESTFTFRIFEEREINQIHPDFNYHLFCNDNQQECQKSTRWPIQKD